MEKLQKSRQKPTSCEQGDKLARELKAVKYVECSALTQVGMLPSPSHRLHPRASFEFSRKV